MPVIFLILALIAICVGIASLAMLTAIYERLGYIKGDLYWLCRTYTQDEDEDDDDDDDPDPGEEHPSPQENKVVSLVGRHAA